MNQHSEPWWLSLPRATFKNNRKYGGYIVHLGIILIFMGVAGTAYKKVIDLDLKPTEQKHFLNYTLSFRNYEERENANQAETYAVLDLWSGSKYLGAVKPARFFYKQQQQPTTVVAILSRLKEDVYFTLGNVDPDTGMARIQVTINPFISWLWFGGLILVIGGLITLLPPAQFQKSESWVFEPSA